jgi:hypothetical protein
VAAAEFILSAAKDVRQLMSPPPARLTALPGSWLDLSCWLRLTDGATNRFGEGPDFKAFSETVELIAESR